MALQSLGIGHTSKGGFCWIWFFTALHCFKDYKRKIFPFDLRWNCPATKAECTHCLGWHLWFTWLQTMSLAWWKISIRCSYLDNIDFLGKKKWGNCCWWYWEFLKSLKCRCWRHFCSCYPSSSLYPSPFASGKAIIMYKHMLLYLSRSYGS